MGILKVAGKVLLIPLWFIISIISTLQRTYFRDLYSLSELSRWLCTNWTNRDIWTVFVRD